MFLKHFIYWINFAEGETQAEVDQTETNNKSSGKYPQFRQPRKRKWQTYWTERLFSRQKTTGEMMSLEEDTRIGNVEEHENLRPRKAILQTQIDVEKVSKGS